MSGTLFTSHHNNTPDKTISGHSYANNTNIKLYTLSFQRTVNILASHNQKNV